MASYVEVWDVNTPQGSEPRSQGDDRIRELKRGLQERLATFTTFPNGNPITILPNAIGAGSIGNDAINTAQIVDGAVTAVKIADKSLTIGKFTDHMQRRLVQVGRYYNTFGASTNHTGVDVVMAPATVYSWGFPLSSGPNGNVPDLQGDEFLILNVDYLDASGTFPTDLLKINFQPQVNTNGFLIYAQNNSASPITLSANVPFRIMMLNVFQSAPYEP